ncbi:MAG TPA: lysine--tRNA ligase, partial [Candidatus Baltobacteraceae bacterium]|nr:lysine--tRNA ligase [Candidatus Baltobacteraceae bacterium]
MLEEEIVRREKVAKLRSEGIDPYPPANHRSASCAQAVAQFEAWSAEAKPITLAGRLRAVRAHGGAAFADLTDESGKLQLHLKSDVIGEASFALFAASIDLGDFIEAEGTLFTTKRGEKSLEVRSWRILAKALLPLPEKWHGLSDVEVRYRKRHLDLIANEDVRNIFRTRSKIVYAIRDFLHGEGFMEVETPILQTQAGGASARPFVTHHNALDLDLQLRVAPELYLKRLIVGGFEKVFEVARCFRNEGISFQHNPEFTQVEFYWAYATYEDLMDLTERMMAAILTNALGRTTVERDGVTLDFSAPYPRKKFYDLVKDETGIDLEKARDEETLKEAVTHRKLKMDLDGAVGYGALVDLLYKTYVRPKIVQPTFVIDYPAEMIPLAKRKPDQPDRIATVQLLVQGIEVTKAYNELNDPLEQEARFLEETRKKESGSEEAMPADADFVEALKYGMPPTAGFGMGIDRLT